MKNVLIAFDNDPSTESHDFFQLCADGVRQLCFDNSCSYSLVCPPDFNEKKVADEMQGHFIGFVASHGITDGVINEKNEEVVSVHTCNYNFCDKIFYCVSCYCACNLAEALLRDGALLFVGYNDKFRIGYNDSLFKECALSGLQHCLLGGSIDKVGEIMEDYYDSCIAQAPVMDKMLLIHNREHLCVKHCEHLD